MGRFKRDLAEAVALAEDTSRDLTATTSSKTKRTRPSGSFF